MPTCPECDGKGGLEMQVSEYWKEPAVYEWRRCPECFGSGIISALGLSIYKARGGIAPCMLP